jgi:hypothetical protein
MRKTFAIAFAAALLAASKEQSSAATVTIGASRDATIFENNVNNGSGGGNGLFAGTNGAGNSPRRALIAFDVAAVVPAGSRIQETKLTLFLGQFPNVGAVAESTIGLHRLSADWGEGTTQQQIPPNDTFGGLGQGAPAVEGDVTWNARFHSATTPLPWTAPGGDFELAISASTVVTRTLTAGYSWESTNELVDNVQGWLNDPASNFGWMMVNADELTSATFRGFYSRHTATAALRPQLIVSYVLAGDFDGNDVVNVLDLASWKAGLGTSVGATHSQGDADADGDVDGSDFLIWQRQVGSIAPAAPTTSPVPEPGGLILLVLASASVLKSRRRAP